MSHVVELSDQAFKTLRELAAREGQAPETVVEALIESARRDGPFYETGDWFRHLGMTDEDIREPSAWADREDADA